MSAFFAILLLLKADNAEIIATSKANIVQLLIVGRFVELVCKSMANCFFLNLQIVILQVQKLYKLMIIRVVPKFIFQIYLKIR